jgi:penicillin-binding protein A
MYSFSHFYSNWKSMQDLKHLTNKRRLPFFQKTRASLNNKKLEVASKEVSESLRLPTGKRLTRLKYTLVFLALGLALTPAFLYVFQKAPRFSVSVSRLFAAPIQKTEPTPKPAPPDSFETASKLLESAAPSGEQLAAKTAAGDTLHYSIRNDLQKRVHDFMAAHKVPYGVFVAIEPSTGRILAMTSHSSVDPQWNQRSYYDIYPMASLFKIITATAALEQKKINPHSVIEFRGRAVSENPRYWEPNPKGRNNRMDVTFAMGKSVNPVYGKIAADLAGKNAVMASVQRFGFNQQILPGLPVKPSTASDPKDSRELMLMGAGLDHGVQISPMHAATMIAAIANGGKMLLPRLTDKVISPSGTITETPASQELRRLVSPENATLLSQMLSTTVTTGTSRKAFHDRRGRPHLSFDVAAKTGSISGTEPKGHYSWFAAYAPLQNPKIAMVALVINQDKWKIKSSQVGDQALQEFFKR